MQRPKSEMSVVFEDHNNSITPLESPVSDDENLTHTSGDFNQSGNKRRISFATNVTSRHHRSRSASQWSRLGIEEEFRGRIDTTGSMFSQFSFTYGTKEIRPHEVNYTNRGNRPSLRQLMHEDDSDSQEEGDTEDDEDEQDGEDGNKKEKGEKKEQAVDEVKYFKDKDGANVEAQIKLVGTKTEEDLEAELAEPIKFDWVKGVLARCLLNIWGVMIFLRIPWCVGEAGMLPTIAIILLSTVVTVITTLSMSAICTNGFIKGGGAYYLISRNLGPEIGGAVGVMFSFANAVAVAMYVVGFAETVRDILIEYGVMEYGQYGLWDVRIIGFITCVFILVIALLSLSLVIKVQLALLVLLIFAIFDVLIGSAVPSIRGDRSQYGYTGYNMTTVKENLWSNYSEGNNFFSVFAIFFPAATGILAGANISGNLKEPEKAIPKGTLLAIMISTAIYIILSAACGACMLRNAGWNEDLQVYAYGLKSITGQVTPTLSFTYYILIGGIVAASLSSAIASLVGAPKVFQAVCNDKLFPYMGFLGKGSKKDDEPRRGYILTFFIGLAFVAVGELNAIAPLISNFFLISYALINGACFIGSVSNSPSWRPSFRFYNKWLAAFGFISCSSIMFLIDYTTALISYFVIAALFAYLLFREPEVNWGTSTSAFAYLSTLQSIMKLQNTPDHVRTFRPQILVLTGNPQDRQALVTLVSCVTKNSSLMICGNLIDRTNPAQNVAEFRDVRKWLTQNKIKSFYSPLFSTSFRQGASSLLQISGLGKFRPNVLFMGYKENWKFAHPKDVEDYVAVIFDAFDFDCAVCIYRAPDENHIRISETSENGVSVSGGDSSSFKRLASRRDTVIFTERANLAENIFRVKQCKGTIDIWWLYDDGGLTVLIPHLISLNWRWGDCQMRVFVSGSQSKQEQEYANMMQLLQKFRIQVQFLKMVPEVNSRPSSNEWEAYKNMQSEFETTSEECDEDEPTPFITKKLRESAKIKRITKRQVRIGQMVREYSTDASIVIVNIPLPKQIVQGHYQYMCWLETLSHGLPPTILMRGNQESVITFYS